MTKEEMRTLEEALAKFQLVKGKSGDGETTACETSLLNWISGDDKWGDSFECAHPLIRTIMIQHNDADVTTNDQRIEAVTLGMTGAIDTWWIPAEVVLTYYGDFEQGTEPTGHERLVKMLKGIAAWKENKVGANLVGANLVGANLVGANLDGANLVRANLVRVNLYGANLVRANLVGANLDGANLVGANLVGANLDGANLYGAYGEPYAVPEGYEFKDGKVSKK
jgi:hypothetical protein